VLRAFRISRIFKLVKRFKSLKIIIDTFTISLPALANVGGLLMLLLYLYAVLAMNILSSIKLQAALNPHANF
jgi:hypothetical protein